MEQLRALAGLSDVLKLSIEFVLPTGLSVATASSRTRVASAPSSCRRWCPVGLLLPPHAAEAPERFVELVGATQTDVFRRDVFGEACVELKPQRGRRARKEGSKRRVTRKRADEGG